MGLRGARPKHYGGDVERSSSGTKIMLPKLTEQQNKFVLEYGSNGGRAIDAYKKAYDCSNMNNNWLSPPTNATPVNSCQRVMSGTLFILLVYARGRWG